MAENRFTRLYQSMNMPLRTYFLRYAIPLVVAGILTTAVIVWLLPGVASDRYFRWLVFAIPLLFTTTAILLPLLLGERRKVQIERNLHLFLIRMSVLATSKLPRKKLMETLSQVKEYEALSDEIEKIYKLMDYWNMGLSDAARVVSKKTPSPVLADFLDRFAHSSDAGEDLEEFLSKEREVVMNVYINKYETALKDLDLLKEIFVAVLISAMFMLVFVSLLPVFMNISINLLLLGVMLLLMIEYFTLYLITKSILPSDPIWHNMKERPQTDRALARVLPSSYAACVALGVFAYLAKLPMMVTIALVVTPLLYPGILIRSEEKKVRARDDNYDAFMRAVAGYAASSGSGVTEGIGKLGKHDFGELTEAIRVLYKRLLTRIDQVRAWNLFAAESGSNLISKFTEMYIIGLIVGGRPDKVIQITSENFVRLLGVRQKRYQSADTLVGILYGLSVGMTFTLFATLSLMMLLNDMNDAFSLSQTSIVLPIALQPFDTRVAEYSFLIIMLVHALISANLVSFASGAHKHSFYIHFAMITWISTLTAILTQLLLSHVLRLT